MSESFLVPYKQSSSPLLWVGLLSLLSFPYSFNRLIVGLLSPFSRPYYLCKWFKLYPFHTHKPLLHLPLSLSTLI